MDIRNFTPAQILMLTRPFSVSGKDLMRYSFLDLVYKDILKVYKEWRLPHPGDTYERLYTLVARGKYFNTYSNSYHQHPFFAPFKEDNHEYQVRTLVRKVYKESGKSIGFKHKRVYKQLTNEGYFVTSLGLKHLNLFFLNGLGSDLGKKFRDILREANHTLPTYANTRKKLERL